MCVVCGVGGYVCGGCGVCVGGRLCYGQQYYELALITRGAWEVTGYS